MTACVINGQRCTQCCQAICLPMSAVRLRQYDGVMNPDADFIQKNWTPISWRRAKKINPYLAAYQRVRNAQLGKKGIRAKSKFSFWTCKNLTPEGCGVYEDRPRICSDFPRYRRSDHDWNNYVKTTPAEYHPDCTEHVVVVLESPREP